MRRLIYCFACWVLCKLNDPIYSPSLSVLAAAETGEFNLICASCKKRHIKD